MAGGLKALGPPWYISIHSAPCFSSTLSRSCSIHQSDSSRWAYVSTSVFRDERTFSEASAAEASTQKWEPFQSLLMAICQINRAHFTWIRVKKSQLIFLDNLQSCTVEHRYCNKLTRDAISVNCEGKTAAFLKIVKWDLSQLILLNSHKYVHEKLQS